MTVLRLPALRSDDTLGFLAAIGTVELCSTALGWNVRLGWERLGGAALLDAPVGTVHDLAASLLGVAVKLNGEGRLVPGVEAGLIPKALSTLERRKQSLALDPLKMTPEIAVRRFAGLQEGDLPGAGTDARWLAALVAQCAPAPTATAGERRLTPLYAPRGMMTLFQLFRDSLSEVTNRPELLEQALLNWRRDEGTGADLDARWLRDGAAASRERKSGTDNQAVLGATWLALQSLPWFTQTGDGRLAEATGWVRGRGGSALRWPVWTALLDVPAIQVVLSHPEIGPTPASPSLGVVGVCEARRRALSKSAGPLQPPVVLWSA
ncbi:MAG: hypothetical protein WD794_08515 [Mycobacteriales bacterium]